MSRPRRAASRRDGGGARRARRPPHAAAAPAGGVAPPAEQLDREINQPPDDQELQQHAEHRGPRPAALSRRPTAVPEQPGTDEPAGQPGQERVALKEAAAAKARSRCGRGKAGRPRRLGYRGDAAAQRLRAVVLEGARSAASHARRAAARGAAGARPGDRRGQRESRGDKDRQQDAPVQGAPGQHPVRHATLVQKSAGHSQDTPDMGTCPCRRKHRSPWRK